MTKRVLLFAAAKECVGQETVSVQLDEDATVAELRTQLVHDYPALERLMNRSLVAINQQYASDESKLSGASEIALIPPVSGG